MLQGLHEVKTNKTYKIKWHTHTLVDPFLYIMQDTQEEAYITQKEKNKIEKTMLNTSPCRNSTKS